MEWLKMYMFYSRHDKYLLKKSRGKEPFALSATWRNWSQEERDGKEKRPPDRRRHRRDRVTAKGEVF